jgi:hypothetical protein
MERTPYCLDFDIVTIARTALASEGYDTALMARAAEMLSAITFFLNNSLNSDYALHRLPGALATMHECALLEGREHVPDLGVAKDVIKVAGWL